MKTSPIHRHIHVVLAFVAILLANTSAFAQTTAARPDRGAMIGASYSVSDIENISLTNGNVNLTIPLAALPPIAGGKLKLTLSAIYNSKLWNIARTENQLGPFDGCPSWIVNTPQASDLGGWRISGSYAVLFRNAHEDFDYYVPGSTEDCEGNSQEVTWLQQQWYRVILVTPDGAEHELRPTDNYTYYGGSRGYLRNYYKETPNSINAPMRYYSFDGSFLYAVINPSSYSTSWTMYMNDGTKIVQYSNGIQRITDTNGNSIKIYSDSNGTHYQDEQTEREIKYSYNPSGNNGLGQGQVQYQTVEGGWESIYINFGTTTVQGKVYGVDDYQLFGGEMGGGMACPHHQALQDTLPVIREIVFPETEPNIEPRKFSFSYNSDTTESATNTVVWSCGSGSQSYTRNASIGLGELSEMVTPLGAVVNYSYSRDNTHFYLFDPNDIPRSTITQKTITHDDDVTDTWSYDIPESAGGCGGTVTAPDGSVTTEHCYPHDAGMAQNFGVAGMSGLVFKTNQSNRILVERHWSLLTFSGANTGVAGASGTATFNPVVDAEYTSLLDPTTHNPVKMSAKTYQYDYNGNMVQETAYDWFDPASVSRGSDGVPTGVPSGATVLRTTSNDYYNGTSSSSSSNVYAKRSLTYQTPLILSALQQSTTGSAITRLSYDGNSYGTAPTVGNLTSSSVYNNVEDAWITTSQAYNSYGNPTSATDARTNVTYFYYDDSTHALPTRVVVDPENSTGSQTTTTAYDFYTGLVTSATDPNNQTTTINYTNQLLNAIDPFGRPGVVSAPAVTIGSNSYHHRVTTTYEDHLLRVKTESDLSAQNDKLLKRRTTTDQLGRPILTEQTEDGTNYTIFSTKVYDLANRITYSSNPKRSSSASTDGWTRATTDVLGRVTEVASFGGASQPPSSGTNSNWTGSVSTSYELNFTTVTDQASKVRRSMVDGLGRLIRVDEPDSNGSLGSTSSPNQATSYTYDAFGNLLTVSQGSQTRTFTYDTLSRLRTAANPESGTVTYVYDANGNLVVKTDARSVSSHYEYDSLNRPTRRWYNGSSSLSSTTNNSPSLPSGVAASDEATFYYDSQSLPSGAPSYTRGYSTGRLVACVYGSGSEGTYRGYDEVGQVVRQYQRTNSVNYLVEATYTLAGGMATETYPSVPGASDRRTVSFSYDNSARLSSLSSSATSYAPAASVSSISYTATNALTSQTYGNNLINAVTYNSRSQTTQIKLGTSSNSTSVVDLNYSYGTTANNGNLQNVTYAGGGLSYTQNFTYDSLNRLAAATETNGGNTNWSQTNAFDRYGNRQINLGGGSYNLSFSSSTNRITTSGFSYDSAGNLTNDTNHTYTFDAENKIKTVDSTTAYTYDGEGQRVRKLVGENTRFVYGIGGALVAEFDGSSGNLTKEYVNGPGLITIEPTAVNSNGTRYLTSDHLGSPRVVTNSSAAVAGRHDYMPFGEELGASVGGRTTGMGFSVADGSRQKFTSKERDSETGLDYFLARYYSSTQARFTSPDPFSIIQMRQSAPNDDRTHSAFMQFLSDPRRWNRFAYAINSPLVFTDKTGLDIMIIENGRTNDNPIGHTAVAITGRGVYSMGNGVQGQSNVDRKNNIVGGSVKKYILDQMSRRGTTIIIIKTTPEQDAAAAKSMEEQAASKPMLIRENIFTDNCTTRVNKALDAAGIPITVSPPNPTNVPGSAGARGLENGNSPTVINIRQNSNLTEADRQAIQPFEAPRNIPAPGSPGGTPIVPMFTQSERSRPEE